MTIAGASVSATSQKRQGIDYSKFDSIEDSDDEKPTAQEARKEAKAAERPGCQNCGKETEKPLRCGTCKKVSYCSASCQKDDWQFHKRNCKKPEEPKAKPAAPERKPPASEKSSGERKKKEPKEETVVENEENFNWYRHREWKPTDEPKREFTPQAIVPTDAKPEDHSASPPKAGSIWNAAGTWEEKDVTAMAQKTLKEKLSGFQSVDAAGGALLPMDVESVEGEASKPVIRGKLRHIFDLSFKVKFSFRWTDSNGQRNAAGVITVRDFTNDTFTEGVLSEPMVELSFGDSKLLDSARKQAVEASLGAGSWPPGPATLMQQVSNRMKDWVNEYQSIS